VHEDATGPTLRRGREAGLQAAGGEGTDFLVVSGNYEAQLAGPGFWLRPQLNGDGGNV
jgi:hypothetical protein